MYYGKFGLLNFDPKEVKAFLTLEYGDYKRKGVKLSEIVKAHRKSLWNSYASSWRMISSGVLSHKQPFSVHRRCEAIYFDNLFPNIHRDEDLWFKYVDKIQEKCEADWKRLDTTARKSATRLVIALRPKQLLTKEISKIFIKMWKWIGYPTKEGSSTHNRFFVFTSSLKGKTAKDKYKYIKAMPEKLHSKICLVADDISFMEVFSIGNKLNIRVSFDSNKVRDNGKRITTKSDMWSKLEKTWRSSKNSSSMLPVVFMSDEDSKKNHDNMDKLIKHYAKKATVVLY